MKHIRPLNRKARRIEEFCEAKKQVHLSGDASDVFALQDRPHPAKQPHIPVGCSIAFFPGWEVDSSGGVAGLCQPSERDLYDCYADCFWPAQVPDHMNNYNDWAKKCAAATQDWRNLDVVFP